MRKRTRDEGRRKGETVAEAFDFNSREESCMTWMESGRDQTLEKETLERPVQFERLSFNVRDEQKKYFRHCVQNADGTRRQYEATCESDFDQDNWTNSFA